MTNQSYMAGFEDGVHQPEPRTAATLKAAKINARQYLSGYEHGRAAEARRVEEIKRAASAA